MFETGFSIDGGLTFTQANIFHNLMRMPGGGGIYDGYLPQGTGGQDFVPSTWGSPPRATFPMATLACAWGPAMRLSSSSTLKQNLQGGGSGSR